MAGRFQQYQVFSIKVRPLLRKLSSCGQTVEHKFSRHHPIESGEEVIGLIEFIAEGEFMQPLKDCGTFATD